MKDYQASIKTPLAHLGLSFTGNTLSAIDFIDADEEIRPCDRTAADVCARIRRYLDGSKTGKRLVIPYSIEGTPFQRKVWKALEQIPPGKPVTYGELATKLNTSARAVGNACRSNPLPVVIPCHRVVSSSGIGGYAGETRGALLRFKSWLLRHEGAPVSGL